jgi:hypothetical protein
MLAHLTVSWRDCCYQHLECLEMDSNPSRRKLNEVSGQYSAEGNVDTPVALTIGALADSKDQVE